ncbi:MAG: copper resistance protein NlpE [Spirochaetaceae bacterium]|jgi:uncharacterized lipoprotein NlpE involved in copper resistance|nr:copper resistance protein NlpE [Spirochaetaceae bacterium]
MKKVIPVFAAVLLCGAFAACASKPAAIDAAHNAQNSLNWAGVYTGIIPAADGPGINVAITLHTDATCEVQYQFIDRENSNYVYTGTFTWDQAGNTIMLDIEDVPPYYRLGENTLTQLDMAGKPITGVIAEHYILRKVD